MRRNCLILLLAFLTAVAVRPLFAESEEGLSDKGQRLKEKIIQEILALGEIQPFLGGNRPQISGKSFHLESGRRSTPNPHYVREQKVYMEEKRRFDEERRREASEGLGPRKMMIPQPPQKELVAYDFWLDMQFSKLGSGAYRLSLISGLVWMPVEGYEEIQLKSGAKKYEAVVGPLYVIFEVTGDKGAGIRKGIFEVLKKNRGPL